MSLPSGTVTFLFTDIEGSTSLWERFPDAMRRTLADHDRILRNAIESNGGAVFKTVGDAFYSVFADAGAGLAAAIASQHGLRNAKWNETGPMRVRMALHTGNAEERDGDFFGPALNRVARLLSAGHGGQILLTASTKDQLERGLPPGAELRDLGERRLKDLSKPAHIFQLISPGLQSDFAPLKTLEAVPNNLPTQLTSFVGREKELAEVKRLLATSHLLTLTGSGGCGKTRLSIQLAADLLDMFRDGVWFVELATLSDPALLTQAVATPMGIREDPTKPLITTLTAELRPKTTLLILDNCEHLVTVCATLTNELLRGCPNLRIVTSSREALGIAGEIIWRVPSLSVSNEESEAVRLFTDRALAVMPGFETEPNAATIVRICQRLDGIPLAIELAAARTNVLSVDQISERLNDRFRLLTGGSRTALPRQRTLRAAIDWSYDLLAVSERTLLRRVSVFSGGFSLQAAESVCGGSGVDDVLELLSRLVEKSLVIVEEHDRLIRYRLLEMVRQYSRDRLMEASEAADVAVRHRNYYLSFALTAEPELHGPNQADWFDALETEHDNLRAALAWSREEREGAETSLKLSVALIRFWLLRAYFEEAREWLHDCLSRADTLKDTVEWAKAVRASGSLALSQADYATARRHFQQALGIFRKHDDLQATAFALYNIGSAGCELGDYADARQHLIESLDLFTQLKEKRGVAASLHALGLIAFREADDASARDLLQQSLVIFREMGDQNGIAHTLDNLGISILNLGRFDAAAACHKESLSIYRALGAKQGMASALNNLGNIALHHGDNSSSRNLFLEALAIYREIGDRSGTGLLLHNLGLLALWEKDHENARSLLLEGLAMRNELGDRLNIPFSLEGFAELALEQSQPQRAVRLYGAAEALREATRSPLPAIDRTHYARGLDRLRRMIGFEAFTAEWAAGREMPAERAVAYARELPN